VASPDVFAPCVPAALWSALQSLVAIDAVCRVVQPEPSRCHGKGQPNTAEQRHQYAALIYPARRYLDRILRHKHHLKV